MTVRVSTLPLDRWFERVRRVRAAHHRSERVGEAVFVRAVDLVIGDRVRWLGSEIVIAEMVVTPHEVLIVGDWNDTQTSMTYLSIESVQVTSPRPVS